MTTTKTTVVLEAQAKGFDKTTRDVKKTFDAMDPADTTAGYKKLDFVMGQMLRQVRGLTEGLKQANQQLRNSGDGGAFKRMADDVKSASDAVDALAKKEKEKADAEERRKKKQSFRMGVLQGAGVGEYFPEGGLTRNAAGRGVGGVGRASVAAPVGGLFSGASGFAAGFNAVPVVGGFIASQLQNLFATAQEFYGYAQAREAMGAPLAGIYADEKKQLKFGIGSSKMDMLADGGTQFGLNRTTVASMLGEMLRTSGGVNPDASTADEKKLVEAMLGASKFGVGASTVGQILRSEKQGGIIAGGNGLAREMSTTETLDRALATAMRTGLDTSEMINAIASGMQDGLRFDAGSLMELTERFNRRGLSAESSLSYAQGIQRIGANIAAQGPRSGIEFHAMRTLFGYGSGGDYSAASFWKAKSAARGGSVDEAGVDAMLAPVINSSMSREGKMIAAQSIFQKLGIDMTESDIETMMNDTPTARAAKVRGRFLAKEGVEMPSIAEAGSKITEGVTKSRAATEDIRIATGGRMIGTVEDFERSQANTVNAAAKLLGPVTKEISGIVRQVSEGANGGGGNFFGNVIDLLTTIARKP